jgi:phosphonate transport system permease protein
MRSKKIVNKNEAKKESLVSPIIAGIISAIIPGLGQILTRDLKRGLVIFGGLITSIGLLIWRILDTGRRYNDINTIISKAYYLNPILYVITGLILIAYIINIIDAYKQALPEGKRSKFHGLMFLILLIFFTQGWEIGRIEPMAIVRDANEAIPALSKIMWPWAKAVEYPEDVHIVYAEIQTPCTDEQFPIGEEKKDEPYIIAEPTCGIPSEVDGELGTEFTIRGGNFELGKEIEIWWKDPINNQFRHRVEGKYERARKYGRSKHAN